MIINSCYKVHHLEDNTERKQYVDNINNYLKKYSTELNSPTIKISNQEEMINFLKENPDFNLNLNGYNLDDIQGWRYGEIGVWASNFLAWKNFLNSDFDYMILMEDDIMFTDNYFPLLSEYINEITLPWDAFFFTVASGQYFKYSQQHDVGFKNVSKTYQDHWLLCYVLNKRGAELAISNTYSGICLPIDWYFFRQTDKFELYTLKPDIVSGCYGSPTETSFQMNERKVMKIDS